MKISIERLCKEVPKEFEIYMTYIKNLQFSEDPDYEFLKDLVLKHSDLFRVCCGPIAFKLTSYSEERLLSKEFS